MIKRIFDIFFSCSVLLLTSPLLIFASIGILLSSRGEIFFKAQRVGKDGETFSMLKFRSMAPGGKGPVISSVGDSRIFPFGAFLRKTKIDELPQFINVLTGDMSIVGPRPEDPKIVEDAYAPWMIETLDVKPGITSPGSLFYYHYGENLIDSISPEKTYIEKVLPKKLATEVAYIRRANFFSDIGIIILTVVTIFSVVSGLKFGLPAKDLDAADAFLKSQADM